MKCKTVPQIFNGELHIGGYTELKQYLDLTDEVVFFFGVWKHYSKPFLASFFCFICKSHISDDVARYASTWPLI